MKFFKKVTGYNCIDIVEFNSHSHIRVGITKSPMWTIILKRGVFELWLGKFWVSIIYR